MRTGWKNSAGIRKGKKQFPILEVVCILLIALWISGINPRHFFAKPKANTGETQTLRAEKPGPSHISAKRLYGNGKGNGGIGQTELPAAPNPPTSSAPVAIVPIKRDCVSNESGELGISACCLRETNTAIECNGQFTNNSDRGGVLSLKEHGWANNGGYITPIMLMGGVEFGSNWRGTIMPGDSVNFTLRFSDKSDGTSQELNKLVLGYFWRDEISGTFILSDIPLEMRKDTNPDGTHHAPSGNFFIQNKIPHCCGILKPIYNRCASRT